MKARAHVVRIFLLVAGLALVAWLVRSAGPERVVDAIARSGPWLPLVTALEALILVADYAASRSLVEDAPSVAPSTWTRATSLAYASSVLLPAGRAAGEATRAATLAPVIGLGAASAACSRLQAAVLLGNAVTCAAIALVVAVTGTSETLAWALAANAVLCAVVGVFLFLLVRSERFVQWLHRRFPRLSQGRAPVDVARRPRPIGTAVALSLAGRCAQAVQYGLVLHAVGGHATARTALAAQGVHLVGATVGDAVPNQMGATEGAYRVFAGALGLADAVPSALSIALVVRVAQLALAAACLLVATLAARQSRRAAEAR